MPSALESIKKLSPNEFQIKYVFGAGLNSAVNSQDIDIRECSKGENFDLLLDYDKLKSRLPFDLVGTATNGQTIRGIIELQKSDGSVSMLVQAGPTVYSWDGTTFTSVGTVSANSALRGGRYSTSLLDNYVIITDLNLATPVQKWDGTTFSAFTHNLGGLFYAKYCIVVNERAIFANVHSGATATPHVILASAGVSTTTASAVGTLTVTNRPSSALSASDPFFLPMPDLRNINGLHEAFGLLVISTEGGRFWQLSGSDSTNFALSPLYMDSAALGDEAIAPIGNDVVYGRAGNIRSLSGTLNFGNVETTDASRLIFPDVRDVNGWTTVFNPRLQKAYFWPLDGNEIYVLYTNLYVPPRSALITALSGSHGKDTSAWSKWTTAYGNADFRQTAVALCKRPGDKLDFVYFGGTSGKLYQLEGSGSQDGGSADVTMYRILPMLEIPNAEQYDITGFINYEKLSAATITIDFLCQGITAFDETISITVPAISGANYFGGAAYFGGSFYFGAQFSKRLIRQNFVRSLRTELIEPKITVSGADFRINDLTLSIKAVTRKP